MISGIAPIVWLFGVPGAGKTTLAKAFTTLLRERGLYNPLHLDGDDFRKDFHPNLGFTVQDRITNITRAANLAKFLARKGVLPVCSFVTPLPIMRAYIKEEILEVPIYFIHVYCSQRCLLEDRRQKRQSAAWAKTISKEVDSIFILEEEEARDYYLINTAKATSPTKAASDLLKSLVTYKYSYHNPNL